MSGCFRHLGISPNIRTNMGTKAIFEYKNHTLFVECEGTTYKDGSEVPICTWLRQHVGQHLAEGGQFAQITRLGSSAVITYLVQQQRASAAYRGAGRDGRIRSSGTERDSSRACRKPSG